MFVIQNSTIINLSNTIRITLQGQKIIFEFVNNDMTSFEFDNEDSAVIKFRQIMQHINPK